MGQVTRLTTAETWSKRVRIMSNPVEITVIKQDNQRLQTMTEFFIITHLWRGVTIWCHIWCQSRNGEETFKGRFRPWSSDLLRFSITIRLHLTRRVLKFGQRFARKRFLMIKIYHIDVSRHLRANLTSCRQDEVLRSQTLQMVTISNVLFTPTNQSLCFFIWFTSQYEAHKQWLTQK